MRFPIVVCFLVLAGCGSAGSASAPKTAPGSGATVRFGPERDLVVGRTVVHHTRLTIAAKMTTNQSDAITRLDALAEVDRSTYVQSPNDLRVGWPKHHTRTKTNGETKFEVDPLEKQSFHFRFDKGAWAIVEDDGSQCESDLCKAALSEFRSTLSVTKKKGGGDGSAAAGSVFAFDAPMSIGQRFDDASALLGAATPGLTFEQTEATLDAVENDVARFGVSGTMRLSMGALGMTVRFKGHVSRRLSDRSLVDDAVSGPLTFEMTSEEVVVHGRGSLEVAESWTWTQ